jgi:hypothetical protein
MPKTDAPLCGEIQHQTGGWQLPTKALNVLCADGIRRTARLGQNDTFFTIKATVQAYGQTVTGCV